MVQEKHSEALECPLGGSLDPEEEAWGRASRSWQDAQGYGEHSQKDGNDEGALEHLSKALMIQLKALGVFWKESLEVADVRYHTGLLSGSRGRLRVRGGCLRRM